MSPQLPPPAQFWVSMHQLRHSVCNVTAESDTAGTVFLHLKGQCRAPSTVPALLCYHLPSGHLSWQEAADGSAPPFLELSFHLSDSLAGTHFPHKDQCASPGGCPYHEGCLRVARDQYEFKCIPMDSSLCLRVQVHLGILHFISISPFHCWPC